MRQNMTEAQIVARMRQLSSRSFHHTRKVVEKHEPVEQFSTSLFIDDRKPEKLENRRQMFEAGKGTRFTKRTHVNKGAHYTKSGGVTSTNRPTAQGEVCSVGSIITVKRFSNSRLTCVCKSKRF